MELGGAEQQLKLLFDYFDKNKFEWHLATLHSKNSLLKNFNNSNVFICDLSKNSKFSFLGPIRLFRYIKKNRILIIHTHLVQSGIVGLLIGKLAGVKCFFYTRHHTNSNKENDFQYFLLFKILRYYTKVICVSKSVYNFLESKSFPTDKLELIYNAVNPIFFTHDKKLVNHIENSIVSVGRLVNAKGYENLIKAVKIINNKIPQIQCNIIGEGLLRKSLEKQIKNIGLIDSVHLLGQRSFHEVYLQLKENDIYICSSIYEGFNLALVEAMAVGKPVISTNTGIAPEIIINNENGILVKNNNPQTIADAVFTLLSNKKLKVYFSQNSAKVIKEKFDVNDIVHSLQNLYMKFYSNKGSESEKD
jgi:glycosyltransferase involved in cell wall biosynthesis